ncbi:hypothetical protein D3C76_1705410 [compost metagenome]
MSLPIPPMAIPTKDFFKAGASFTPSPTIQTLSSPLWNLSIMDSLSSGKHSE